jgi:hypothetical protein
MSCSPTFSRMAVFTPMPRDDARRLVDNLTGFFTMRPDWSWAEMPPAATGGAEASETENVCRDRKRVLHYVLRPTRLQLPVP